MMSVLTQFVPLNETLTGCEGLAEAGTEKSASPAVTKEYVPKTGFPELKAFHTSPSFDEIEMIEPFHPGLVYEINRPLCQTTCSS